MPTNSGRVQAHGAHGWVVIDLPGVRIRMTPEGAVDLASSLLNASDAARRNRADRHVCAECDEKLDGVANLLGRCWKHAGRRGLTLELTDTTVGEIADARPDGMSAREAIGTAILQAGASNCDGCRGLYPDRELTDGLCPACASGDIRIVEGGK